MKKIILSAFAALVALSSCVKESPAESTPPAEEVGEVSANVVVHVYGHGAGTKAGDANAPVQNTDEAAIKNLTVFVFKKGATDNVDEYTLESSSNVTLTANGANSYKATIKTSPGDKLFIAVANNDKQLADWVENESLAVFKARLLTVATDLEKGPGEGEAAKPEQFLTVNIAQAGAFMMVSDAVTESLTGTTATVTLTCERLSAKAQMKWDEATVKLADAAIFKPNSIDGVTISDPVSIKAAQGKFMLMNLQSVMQVQNPFGSTLVDKGTFLPWQVWYKDAYLNAADGKYVFDAGGYWKSADNTFSGVPANSFYAPENMLSADTTPKRNEVTCMLVRTRIDIDGDGTYQNEGTFQVLVTYGDKKLDDGTTVDRSWKNFDPATGYHGIYTDPIKAGEALDALIANEPTAELRTYINGYAYHRIDLVDYRLLNGGVTDLKTLYSVKRNNFYQVNIGRLLNIGWNEPGELVDKEDNTDVNDPRVSVDATINVKDWVTIPQDADLQ